MSRLIDLSSPRARIWLRVAPAAGAALFALLGFVAAVASSSQDDRDSYARGAYADPAGAATPPALINEAPRLSEAERAEMAAELRARGLEIRDRELAALPEDAPAPESVKAVFDLIDQTGHRLTDQDLRGRTYALFFGYVTDTSICSVVLPRIAGAMNMLEDAGLDVTPIVVTIDPTRDTPEAMAEALPRYHPRLIGLTGSADELARTREDFHLKLEKVAELPDGSPLYIHGNLVYLVDGEGEVLTLLPPLTSPSRMAAVFASYL